MSEAKTSSAELSQAGLEHLDALYGFAMALSHDPVEAEDLVQETYLHAVRAVGQRPPEGKLKSWLFVILRNLWLNRLRHARSGPRFVELEAEDESGARWLDREADDPHALYVTKLEREQVRAAIASLPRPYREVVVLRELEGFSYQQIAGILECPAGTVMSRLNRAREKLRLRLGQWRAEAAPKSMGATER